MRLKTVIAVAATLAVVGLIIWQVAGTVHRTFGLPAGVAQVAKSTPAYQHGLTLLGIQNVSPDGYYSYADLVTPIRNSGSHSIEADTGLWVKMPSNFSIPPNCDDSTYNNCSTALSATARMSNGLTIPLGWRTTNNRSTGDNVILLVSIPAGYPDTVRWADVTVDDHRGGQATWRILHLPPMQHVLGPGTVAQTTFQSGAIHATARAYVGKDPNSTINGKTLLCDIKGTVKASPHQWDLGPMTLTREWEAPGFGALSSNSTFGTGTVHGVTHFEATADPIYYDRTHSASVYLPDTHWVRLTARLQEYETRDETVVFHNLTLIRHSAGSRYLVGPSPEMVSSTSGATITLTDPRTSKNEVNFLGSSGDILMMIRFDPSTTVASLPRSPLWKRFKGVVTLSCSIPEPYSGGGATGNGKIEVCFFHTSRPLPKVVANFPVIVRQRVNLRAVPMTFVLPVEK